MPKKAEEALWREANKHNWSDERKRRYVYGALRHKLGWVPSHQRAAIRRRAHKK